MHGLHRRHSAGVRRKVNGFYVHPLTGLLLYIADLRAAENLPNSALKGMMRVSNTPVLLTTESILVPGPIWSPPGGFNKAHARSVGPGFG
jgi:hypothetical protein